MNKRKYFISILVNIIYLTVLTFMQNPLKENYSMMSSSLLGYFAVLGLCILLSFNFFIISKCLSKRYVALSIGPIIGGILPYFNKSGNLISNMHEIFAYISFGMTVFITIINIYNYKMKYIKTGNIIFKIFFIILFIDTIIYLDLMGVTGIQEYILLTVILIINLFMYKTFND